MHPWWGLDAASDRVWEPNSFDLDCADGELELVHPDLVIGATALFDAKEQNDVS
jgi:hypothetical protein